MAFQRRTAEPITHVNGQDERTRSLLTVSAVFAVLQLRGQQFTTPPSINYISKTA